MKIEIPEKAQMLVADQVAKKLGIPIGISDVKIVIDLANEVINNPQIAIETSLKCGGLMTLPYYLAYKNAGRDIGKMKQYLKGAENEKPTSVKDIFKKSIDHVKDNMKNTVNDVSDVVKTNINMIQKAVVKPKFWISLVRVISTSGADIPADVSLCMVMADAMKDEISDRAKMAAESLLTENTKITLTIKQIARLIAESNMVNEDDKIDPNTITDMGNVLRMNPCHHQRKMCWNYNGYVFVHKNVNPKFNPAAQYMILIVQNGKWQMHFENFNKNKNDPKVLDDLYKAFAQSCKSGLKVWTAGGCTPGGLSGISKLANYGFKKQFVKQYGTLKEYDANARVYWSGGMIDPVALDKWLNEGKHMDEFLVINKDETISMPKDAEVDKFTADNTMPRPFIMIKS